MPPFHALAFMSRDIPPCYALVFLSHSYCRLLMIDSYDEIADSCVCVTGVFHCELHYIVIV